MGEPALAADGNGGQGVVNIEFPGDLQRRLAVNAIAEIAEGDPETVGTAEQRCLCGAVVGGRVGGVAADLRILRGGRHHFKTVGIVGVVDQLSRAVVGEQLLFAALVVIKIGMLMPADVILGQVGKQA